MLFFVACSSQNLAVVENTKGANVLNTEGNTLLKESYDKAYLYDEMYIKVESKDKFGIVNLEGRVLLKPIYESISILYKGYATIELNGKVGLINKSMDIVLPTKYESIRIEEEHFILQTKNQYHCMNSEFKMVGKSYDYIYYFQEGFARVETEEKFGFIDEMCQEAVEPKYDYVSDFMNGFSKIKENNTFSFLNTELKIITKEEFKNLNNFEGR